MAKIREFEPGMQTVKPHPTEVHCYFQQVVGSTGEVLLHLSTFGSSDRESAPKSSQSLQLGVEAARSLVEIIEATFPSLRQGHSVKEGAVPSNPMPRS